MVSPQVSTVNAIRQKIRKLTTSPNESSLTTQEIDEKINTVILQDFPSAIKIDQLRSVYTFYTSPNVDYYPLNVNFNQSVRAPVYFEGIQGVFYKSREQFFNLFPRWPTLFQVGPATDSGAITDITQDNNGVVTADNNLSAGDYVTLSDVGGMTEVNGQTYQVVSATTTTFTIDQDTTAFTPYTTGGSYFSVLSNQSFTISNTPFLPKSFVLGGETLGGNVMKIFDNGDGILYYSTAKAQDSIPPITSNVPGFPNQNTGNPGDQIVKVVGSINYVTGSVTINFNQANVAPGNAQFKIWVSQYQAGRPYCLLFWNNYFLVRPVPDKVYKVEVETYLTPVEFTLANEVPILTQWWQYIAYVAAREILRERQDFDAVQDLQEGFLRQEQLVLERQACEEIGQRNSTIFSDSNSNPGYYYGWGYPW